MNNTFIDFISKDTRYKHISETQFKSVYGKYIELYNKIGKKLDKVWMYSYSDNTIYALVNPEIESEYRLEKMSYCSDHTMEELYGRRYNVFSIAVYVKDCGKCSIIFGINSIDDYDYIYKINMSGNADIELMETINEIIVFAESHDTLDSDDFVEFVNDKFKNAERL